MVALLVAQMVIVTPPPAMAAGNFVGGADRYPLYVMNDHTAYAVHFWATGLTPNATYYAWARFCPNPYPGGGNQWGYTWNGTAQRWVQEREANTNHAQVATNASGEITSNAGWIYAKYGCTGNTSGRYLVISLSPDGGSGTTLNSETSTTPSLTVLDASTAGSWIHNGIATGHQAAKRADVTSDTVSTEIYSMQKTEANVLDDDGDGTVDNENYGPSGATGDFRFGVPTATSVDVRLNQTAWTPGNNFVTGPVDVDLAVGAAETIAPDAPTGLTATAGSGSVGLSWNAASDNGGGSGVTGYNVYRWTAGTDDFHWTPDHVRIATVTSGTTYTDSTVTNGTPYYYEVRAVDVSTNVGPRSGTANATPDGTPPADVTNLTVVDFGSTDATLTWTAPGDDGSSGTATEYDLRYSTSPITDEAGWLTATPVPGPPTPQAAGNMETYRMTGLTEGQHYYFALKTKDDVDNWSGLSNQAETTPTAPPEGTMLINNGASYTTTTTVSVNSTVSAAVEMRLRNEGGSWSDWASYDTSVPFTLSDGDGAKSVEVEYKNSAEETISISDAIILDTAAPTGTMSLNNGASYTATRTVSINSTVTGATEMRKRNTGLWSAWMSYEASVTHQIQSGDGTKPTEVEYRDAAGNVLSLTDTIILDTVAPSGTMSLNNGALYTTTRNVSINSTVTGAVEMRRRNTDGGGSWQAWGAYTPTFTPHQLQNSNGLKNVEAEYRDEAGNVLLLSDTITLDMTGPTGSISINSGAATTSQTAVSLTLSASDTNGIGLMRLSNDGVFDTESWEFYASPRAWTLTSGDGTKTVSVQYQDVPGNISTLSDDIVLATAPTNVSLSPTSGSSDIDATQTFTTVCSDPNGATDIDYMQLMIHPDGVHGHSSAYLMYSRATNRLYLRDDGHTTWLGGYAPGSANIIQNSQVRVDCANTTVSTSGNNLTVNWRLSFKAAYAGNHTAYMRTYDMAGAYDGFDTMGTWRVL